MDDRSGPSSAMTESTGAIMRQRVDRERFFWLWSLTVRDGRIASLKDYNRLRQQCLLSALADQVVANGEGGRGRRLISLAEPSKAVPSCATGLVRPAWWSFALCHGRKASSWEMARLGGKDGRRS